MDSTDAITKAIKRAKAGGEQQTGEKLDETALQTEYPMLQDRLDALQTSNARINDLQKQLTLEVIETV